MSPSRRIAVFLISVIIIYAALLCAWVIIHPAYAAAFRAAAAVMYSDIGVHGTVRFEPVPHPDASHDTTLILRNYTNGKEGRFEVSSRFVGYLPTAMLVALIAATPLTVRRRLIAMALGLVLVNLFIAARLWIVLLSSFSDPNSLAMFHPGPIAHGILEFLMEVLYVSLVGGFVGPIIIWMIVCLRRRNWDAMLGGAARTDDAQRA